MNQSKFVHDGAYLDVSVRKDNSKAKRPDLAQRLERRERVAYKQRKQQVREQEFWY